jgi:hypothetical protein
MEKLLKPVEYAKELGISRQAVYAQVKRGVIPSKNIDGKLYIIVEEDHQPPPNKPSNKSSEQTPSQQQTSPSYPNYAQPDYAALLEAKDETISVLKGTVKDLKKSNKQMSTTLRGEIDLLKDAFHEMRTMYVAQIEHVKRTPKVEEDTIDVFAEASTQTFREAVKDENTNVRWVGFKKFFKQYSIVQNEHKANLKKVLIESYEKGDKRVSYRDGKFQLNINEQFIDIFRQL